MNKKFKVCILGGAFLLSACGSAASEEVVEDLNVQVEQEEINPLIIVGEGGPSGAMFIKAANTYKNENGGVIYEVHSGDDFIAAINDFLKNNGKIKHLEFFGHGNHVGLYVNQEANINGGLYANDPALNVEYRAASIYEVPNDIFAKNGWIKFNGCNVAGGEVESASLAQNIANYFDVDVVAPRGPTEFSKNSHSVDPIENSNFLNPDFAGDVYMVPTYSDKPFVVSRPQEVSASGFVDVRVGQEYESAVVELAKLGLDLNFEGQKFLPHKNITYGEAVEFCKLTVEDDSKCRLSGEKDGEILRNLKALQLLVDARGVGLKRTNPWHDSYIYWANNSGLLTRDFTNKKWYTRAEMAELTWNFIKSSEQ